MDPVRPEIRKKKSCDQVHSVFTRRVAGAFSSKSLLVQKQKRTRHETLQCFGSAPFALLDPYDSFGNLLSGLLCLLL